MRKHVLAILIAAVVLAPAFAGGTEEDAGATADVIQLEAYTADFGISPLGTLVHEEWMEQIQQYLGEDITIDFTVIPWGEYGEKVNITLASGDYPDIFTVPDANAILEYGDQELIVNLAEHEELIPNYMSFVEGTPGYERSVYTPAGDLYAFYDGYTGEVKGTQYNWAYRFDVFQEYDIKVPETLDEFLNAARRLKALFPDSYPVGTYIANNAAWYSVQRPFLAVNQTDYTHYWDGSKYVYGPTEESYREALAFVNQLYLEELLDPEFTVITGDQRDSKALNGETFILPNFFGANVYRYNSNTESDAVWGIAMPPRNRDIGDPWMIGANPAGKLLRTWTGIVIDAQSDHVETAVRLVDSFYTDEMIELLNWGIEGETFARDGDGNKYFLDEFMNSENPTEALAELGVSSTMRSRSGIIFTPQDFAAQIALMKPHPFYAEGEYFEGKYWVHTWEYGRNMIRPAEEGAGIAGLTYSPEEREFRQINLTPVQTFVDESAIKFITGELSIEDDWDDYLIELRQKGDIEEVTRQMTAKMR